MGRRSEEQWLGYARDAWASWPDGTALAASEFAANDGLDLIAESRYRGLGELSRGLALRDVVRQCLVDLAQTLDGHEPLASIIRGKLEGRTQAETARTLHMSETWLSKRYKRLLVSLLLDALQSRLGLLREAAKNRAA